MCYRKPDGSLGTLCKGDMRMDAFAVYAAPQPAPSEEIYDELRYLRKWLNEENTAPIDRVALAKVLTYLIRITEGDMPSEVKDAARLDWQPIETAPKTGRTILLGYVNSHGNWRTLRGQWFSEEAILDWEEPDDFDAGWYETSVEADDPPNCWITEPTHWMPLPTPPYNAAMQKEQP